MKIDRLADRDALKKWRPGVGWSRGKRIGSSEKLNKIVNNWLMN
jgi:hypothetical protein